MFVLWVFIFGYLFQHLGSILQILRIEKKRETNGVCIDTQILFIVGTIARLCWISDTLLKDMLLTYLEIFLSFAVLFYSVYICLFKYNESRSIIYFINNTSIPIYLRWYVILTVSMILSYFYFPGNEGQKWDIQMLVSLNIFSESAGLLPQIYAMNSQKESQIFSSLYLFCLTISKILRLVFWLKMYWDDNSFVFLVVADVLHLLMVSGFIFSFFKNFNEMVLPGDSKRIEAKRIF
jgi:hypothetical protein